MSESKAPTLKRAAEVLREYAALIEESEQYRAGPMKGRCDPPIEEEITEYRSLADLVERTASERRPTVRWVPVAASIAMTRVNEVTIGLHIFGHDQEGQWYRLDGHIEEPK